ncbi:MAG: hypothetical protein ACRDTJ_28915, partial [Pseudonocardiaceae bacterium]
ALHWGPRRASTGLRYWQFPSSRESAPDGVAAVVVVATRHRLRRICRQHREYAMTPGRTRVRFLDLVCGGTGMALATKSSIRSNTLVFT